MISIGLGILLGFVLLKIPAGRTFAGNWIKPFGTIFMNLLKMLAMPLILTSLIKGISDLKDMTSLSRIGIRTFGWYIITTFIAIAVGLLVVYLIKPGYFIQPDTRNKIMYQYSGEATEEVQVAKESVAKGPLEPLVEIVPDNIFQAATSNGNMLQVIMFAVLFGVALLLIPPEKTVTVRDFFAGANEVILRIINIVMSAAPVGVFALMVTLVTETPSADIFIALGMYGFTVLLGLALLLYVIYPTIVKYIGGMPPGKFLKGMVPAQLMAFSTSSAAATLPVTMQCLRNNLGISEEVTSFVGPVGATINMDGTTLYQSVAVVFIAQALGYDLSFGDVLSIVFTAALAGFGSAAVPGAGIVMLIIVLQSVHINPAAISLIFAIDRPLDMCRTVVNVSGDGMIATIIQRKATALAAADAGKQI